jgi:hypothetical protein
MAGRSIPIPSKLSNGLPNDLAARSVWRSVVGSEAHYDTASQPLAHKSKRASDSGVTSPPTSVSLTQASKN